MMQAPFSPRHVPSFITTVSAHRLPIAISPPAHTTAVVGHSSAALVLQVGVYFGPKPQETLASSAADIQADGSYSYPGWVANYMFDWAVPTFYGFAWPNANGLCLSTIGGPEIPAVGKQIASELDSTRLVAL